MAIRTTRRSAIGLTTAGVAFVAGLVPFGARADDVIRPTGWTAESHGDDVVPNYAAAFPPGRVVEMAITVTPGNWAAMLPDLDAIYAPFLPIREGVMAVGAGLSRDDRIERARQLMQAAMQAPDAADRPRYVRLDRKPMWVPATVRVDGREWTHVGLRFKGNTSLTTGYMAGDIALPFKLDFDEFEDDFPQIDDQRFFGFKELSFATNLHDPAGLREILVYDILREAGLPSLRAVPCDVVLDHGEGRLRLGLYTVIEVVDDTGVPTHFGSDDGNIYEGIGPGASFALATADQLEPSLEKKNNERAADWSDVRRLHAVLHDPRRLTDPAAWRDDLEAVFDVDGFLSLIGIGSFIGHFDTYGTAESVNFYLYHDSATGRLTWISWDHNDTFQTAFAQTQRISAYDRGWVTADFPLIRFLLDDPVYRARHVQLLSENTGAALDPGWIDSRISDHAGVIGPVATRDMPEEDYDAAVAAVRAFVRQRADALSAFLASRP